MRQRAPLGPQDLLGHAGFLRGVVRALVRDEHEAEDVLQETYVRALAHGRPPRAWLATVARNFARMLRRGEGRRLRRERAVARAEASPSAAERVERLELLERVVSEIRRLEPAQREVIVLRFYDALPVREVARRLGVPAETARTRLRRALATLRARLDAVCEGDRRAWQLALLPLAGAAPRSVLHSALTGGFIMKSKLAIAVFALLALGVLAYLSQRPGPVARVRSDAERIPARTAPGDGEQLDPGGGGVPIVADGTARESARPPASGAEGAAEGGESGRRAASGEQGAADAKETPTGSVVLVGQVMIAEGPPAVGAKVQLKGTTKAEDRWISHDHEATADETGAFSFADLPDGSYQLSVTLEGYAPHEARMYLREGAKEPPLSIVLTRGGSLRVRVVDSQGRPREGESILIQQSGTIQRTVAQGRTDADGCLFAEHLVAGEHSVEWHLPGNWRSNERSATVIPGKIVEVVFRAESGLTGTVYGPDGEPLPEALVRLTPVDFGDEGYRNHREQADKEGHFAIEGIPAGEYAIGVQVLGKDGFSARVGTVTLPVGTTVDQAIRLPATRIAGRVTLAESGKPLDSRQVQIAIYRVHLLEDGTPDWNQEFGGMAFAGADGRYAFLGLPPGTYKIWIAPLRGRLKECERVLELGAGARIDGVDFSLETMRMGGLKLTVLEPDGTPAKGLNFTLMVEKEGKNGESVSTATTIFVREIGDGIYYVPLEVGERTVGVYREGFVAEAIKVVVDADKVPERKLTLRPAGE